MLLILIGYRATGKTTLAKCLAEQLGYDWIDADVEIERRANKSIASIFADQGEPAFRDLEAQVIQDLCKRDRLVIATGGGAPIRETSRQLMHSSGTVIWLTAHAETILHRMSGDATTASRRPQLTDQAPLDEIRHLLETREPFYRETAHLCFDTEKQDPSSLCTSILEALKPTP